MNPPSPQPRAAGNDVTAGVIASVAAITAELANPVASEQVAAALQRLTVIQSLATAIQDAVADLRGQTTTQLAAVGGAAAKLIETGDVRAWRATVDALQLATRHSQHRLESLVELARHSLATTSAPAAPSAN